MWYPLTKCRACQSVDLQPVLDLHVQPLANDFTTVHGERAGYAPLKVLYCPHCTLAQLSVVVRPEILYRDYPYVTSKSAMMARHFDTILDDLTAMCSQTWACGDLLEIGSNDGMFLEFARRRNISVCGIEPASNLAAISTACGIKTVNQLWNTATAVALGESGYKADVIVARHVFAHIDDWQDFVHALDFVTHADSLVFIEVPYVMDTLAVNSWDNVYHEHLSFVSITAIENLLKNTQWQVHQVRHYPIHAGVIGIILRRRTEHLIGEIDQHPWEAKLSLDTWRTLDSNKTRMVEELKLLVRGLRDRGLTVCGFGASAKSTVWLNACGFTKEDIAFVCDCTPQKQGKLCPGTDIPVVPENGLEQADAAICFAWNYFPEIKEAHKGFTGKWIVPVPEVRIVE